MNAPKLERNKMKLTPRQEAIRDAANTPPTFPTPIDQTVTFDDLLALLAPLDSKARRSKLFHSFFVGEVVEMFLRTHREPDEIEIERIARENEAVFKSDGVPLATVRKYSTSFPAWRKEKTSEARSANARKMHQKQAAAAGAKQIEKAANTKASARKNRIEYVEPKELERMAEHLQD